MTRRTRLLVLVALVLSLPGLWFITVYTLIPVWRWSGSDAWVKTPCTVVRAEILPMKRKKRGGFFLDLEYRYVAGGTEQFGTAYDFAADGPRGKSESQVVRPEGASTCFVDPHDPTSAVLNRDWSPTYLNGLYGCIWLALPAGLLLIVRRRTKPDSKSEHRESETL